MGVNFCQMPIRNVLRLSYTITYLLWLFHGPLTNSLYKLYLMMLNDYGNVQSNLIHFIWNIYVKFQNLFGECEGPMCLLLTLLSNPLAHRMWPMCFCKEWTDSRKDSISTAPKEKELLYFTLEMNSHFLQILRRYKLALATMTSDTSC